MCIVISNLCYSVVMLCPILFPEPGGKRKGRGQMSRGRANASVPPLLAKVNDTIHVS